MRRLTQNRMRRNKSYRRLTAALLSGAVVISSCLMGVDFNHAAGTEDTELQSPRVEMNTCDTVYFGNYWQEDTNGDGVADQNDEKTPIRWRILSRNGNDAYVMADQILAYQQYHEKDENVTWETSTLRKWLNEEFYNAALTSAEQEAVLPQMLVNEDNEKYGTDTVYLPSYDDMVNEDYGFLGADGQARIGRATTYAKEQGGYGTGEEGNWWWMFPSNYSTAIVAAVNPRGGMIGYGSHVHYFNYGVRPALHLDLSSPLVQQGDRIEVSMKCAVWDLVELGNYEGKRITWRVLQRSGNDLFLLSDQILTDQVYYELDESISWKDSSLRSWLNGDFYKETFTGEEQVGIRSYLYENPDNPWYGTEGGEDTTDNISLLSLEDIINLAYGFPSDYYCEHSARTAYSPEDDRDSQYGSWWWLRSPGLSTYLVAGVDSDGSVDVLGDDACDHIYGVRPVLHFDISKYPLTKVGTVTAKAERSEYQWNGSAKPNVTNQPDTTQQPGSSNKPNTTTTPSETNPPQNTESPSDATPSATSSGSDSVDSSGTVETPSISDPSPKPAKNQPTKLNIKNKKKYPLSKKLTIRDANGIRSVKLNGKNIKIKAGKKSISFKLSKYKKKLKKKGKWNRLVIIDQKGKKTTVKFKIK